MEVIRKINNNVAECVDGKGRHLIAFGKGIGFPATPYELTDLSKVKMTFYQLDSHYEKLISEIPETVFLVSSQIVKYVQQKLGGRLSPTLVIGLADHISFALKMVENGQRSFLYSNQIAVLYPKETELARHAVKYIESQLGVRFPPNEVSNIAMHFVNAQQETELDRENQLIEEIIAESTRKMEQKLQISIDIEDYSYVRFQMHFRHFLTRIKAKKEKNTNREDGLYEELKNRNPEIFNLVLEICEYVSWKMTVTIPKSEQVYLMIHTNRLYDKNIRE